MERRNWRFLTACRRLKPAETVYRLGDVELAVPQDQLAGPLKKALEAGRFERLEVRAVELHLRADDRVLDLGAGAGLVTIHCARKVGSDHVVSVEPNPAMIPVIQGNLDRNGLEPVTLHHGAVVAASNSETVDLFLHGGFWAASLDRRDTPRETRATVPAMTLGSLVDRHDPTVIIADLEGAEAEIFSTPLPGQVRLVVLELHPKRYAAETIAQIFEAMAVSGLTYCPDGSQGKIVVFQRVFANR